MDHTTNTTRRSVAVVAVRTLVVLCAIALFVTAAVAACGDLDVPTAIDFGVVEPGVSKRVVHIVNRSWRTATIESLSSNCGCTVADTITPQTLRPGDSIDVPLLLDTSHLSGPVTKFLYIQIVGEKPQRQVTVHATVDRNLAARLVPSSVDLDAFGDWETPQLTVRLDYAGSRHYGVEIPEQVAGFSMVKLTDVTFSVAITKDLPDGPFSRDLKVAGPRGDLSFRVSGTKHTHPFLRDSLLVLKPSEKGGELVHQLLLRHRDGAVVNNIVARASNVSAKITDTESVPGEGTRLVFSLPADAFEGNNSGDFALQAQSDGHPFNVHVPFVLAKYKKDEGDGN